MSCFLVFTFSLFSFNDLFISVILQILVSFCNLNARIYVGFPCRIKNHLLPCKVNNKQNNRKLPVLSFAQGFCRLFSTTVLSENFLTFSNSTQLHLFRMYFSHNSSLRNACQRIPFSQPTSVRGFYHGRYKPGAAREMADTKDTIHRTH